MADITKEETTEEEKVIPSLEEVEAELNREKKKNRHGKTLKRIAIALVVVAAIAVILAVLVTPVLQITGTSMTNTLQDQDIVW